MGCCIIRVLVVVVKVILGRGFLLGQACVRIIDALELDGGLSFVVWILVRMPAGAAGEAAEKDSLPVGFPGPCQVRAGE